MRDRENPVCLVQQSVPGAIFGKSIVPKWVDSIADLREFVFDAHKISVNCPSVANQGDQVRIGILDSLQNPPKRIARGLTIGTCESFVSSLEDDTTSHGTKILDIILKYSPRSEFNFYQAVEENGRLPVQSFDAAIYAAIEDDVDLLNISAGEPWEGPIDAWPMTKPIRDAIDAGITIVAAAGNDPAEPSEQPINCPAAIEDVIAVGGFEVLCEGDGDHPDGAYWAHKVDDQAEDEYPDITATGVYCGQRGCGSTDCIKAQEERPWDNNPRPTNGKPDVVAPVHLPNTSNEGNPYLEVGTSFASPIVTGGIGLIFSELLEEQVEVPPPEEVREVVLDTSSPIDRGDYRKFNVTRSLDTLLRE